MRGKVLGRDGGSRMVRSSVQKPECRTVVEVKEEIKKGKRGRERSCVKTQK